MLQLWVDHTLCQRMPTERIFNQSLLDAKVQKLTKSEKTKEEPATKVVPQKEVEEIKTEENAAALTSRDASLQGMLEEASKMLRVINVPEDGKQKADKVQEKRRLEELRKELQSMEAGSWRPSMKMFRSTATVARIKKGLNALLDTGATHAMRPRKTNEELGGDGFKEVRVNLAAGGTTRMWMTSGGTFGSSRSTS